MSEASELRLDADRRGIAVAGAAALALYLACLCPVVFWGDSAEFARAAVDLQLSPVARGYPLHRLLTWSTGSLLGDPALGANLVSALFGAVTVALVYEAGRLAGRSRAAGAAAAGAVTFAHTFWSYAVVAEVYTLHTALLAAVLVLGLRVVRGAEGGWLAMGAVLGIGLLHHRMIFFAGACVLYLAVVAAPPRQRLRTLARLALGFAAGAVPFAVLCVVASRTPPSSDGAVLWWLRDVFLGGDRNADFFLGEGRKSLVASTVYLARFIAFNLPGPGLVAAAAGLVLAARAWGIARAGFLWLLLALHVVFPLRYDWTGDQYAFLTPLYPVLAVAAAVAIGWLGECTGRRVAAVAAAVVVVTPPALYLTLAVSGWGERLLPRLSPEAARTFLLPARRGDRRSRDVCIARLARVPPGAVLHADWGDGQVFLHLQRAEGLRPDVEVRIWYDRIRLADASREQWVSVMPLRRDPPRALTALAAALEDQGGGLWRLHLRERAAPEPPR